MVTNPIVLITCMELHITTGFIFSHKYKINYTSQANEINLNSNITFQILSDKYIGISYFIRQIKLQNVHVPVETLNI